MSIASLHPVVRSARKVTLGEIIPLALILLVGFGLRIFQLGHDSLWGDEAGIAVLASFGSVRDVLAGAQAHVMAMPLDYVVAWLAARISLSEFMLRLPAVLWGTLTLSIAYRLFAEVYERKTALIAALLLALSPLHVQYSQELRFYAALVFFYCAATYTLLRALKMPDFRT